MDDLIICFASGIVVGFTLMASVVILKDIDDTKTEKRTNIVSEVDLVLDQPQTMRFETVIVTSKIGEVER